MTYTYGGFQIEDLSSEDIPSGTFTIVVTLSDGKLSVVTDITVIFYDPPVFETIEEIPFEEEEVDETATGEDIEVTSVVNPTGGSSGSDGNSTESAVGGELQPQTEPEVLSLKVFDWREAFKSKEKKMIESRSFFEYKAPQPRLQFIA